MPGSIVGSTWLKTRHEKHQHCSRFGGVRAPKTRRVRRSEHACAKSTTAYWAGKRAGFELLLGVQLQRRMERIHGIKVFTTGLPRTPEKPSRAAPPRLSRTPAPKFTRPCKNSPAVRISLIPGITHIAHSRNFALAPRTST